MFQGKLFSHVDGSLGCVGQNQRTIESTSVNLKYKKAAVSNIPLHNGMRFKINVQNIINNHLVNLVVMTKTVL